MSRRRGVVATASGLFMLTMCFRGVSLGRPQTFVFDEIFYANDALDLFTHGAERTFVGHPPLGKWLISIGFLFGHFSSTTWRLSALVAGSVVVVLVFLCVERLTASLLLGVIASALLLTDGIAHFVGRYAHLDGFTTLFSTGALGVLLVTQSKDMRYRTAMLVGVLCGAALACKWAALPVLPLAVAVCMLRARRAGPAGRALALGATVVGAAVLVYFGSFAPWIIGGAPYGNCTVPACSTSAAQRLVRLPAMQVAMFQSDNDLTRTTNNRDPAWRWVIQDRPLVAFIAGCQRDLHHRCQTPRASPTHLLVRGNPVVWVVSLPLFVAWLFRRLRGRPSTPGVGLAFAWAFALWLPWLLQPEVYLYYAAPVVPALTIAVVVGAANIAPRRVLLPAMLSGLVIGALRFVWSRPGAPWSL